jgi:hypothetical protein
MPQSEPFDDDELPPDGAAARYTARPARHRWYPDAADVRYAAGAGDADEARYDAAWRRPAPRE